MKLTFVIISYNEKEYLEQAIQSCIDQKLENYEIIIGDDGSSDGSIELLEKYANNDPEHIKYFVSDRTGIVTSDIIASLRVSDVIKRALAIASGEYCVILSGDDYFYPGDFFCRAMDFLEKNPAYVTYVGGYEKVWEDRPPIADFIRYPRKIYWSRKYVHLSTFVFRKSVFDEGKFLQRFCDDTGLQYSLAFAGKWKCESTIMFAYRQRSGSIMHTANRLQNCIIELMIFQDVLCKGYLRRQSLAKYGSALRYVFEHRQELDEARYKKYLMNCQKFEFNILEYIYDYDKKSPKEKSRFQLYMVYSLALEIVYRIIGRILNLTRKNIK